MLEYIVFPAIAATLGGLATWFISQRIDVSMRGIAVRSDCRVFSGTWHSIHFTESPERSISRHRYSLQVSRAGKISGTLTENATSPPWEYRITGRIGPGGWTMRAQSLLRADEFALETYFNDLDQRMIVGFIVSYDMNRQPFCSLTVLSRDEIEEEAYRGLCTAYADRFYIQ